MWIDSHCHLDGLNHSQRCSWVDQASLAGVRTLVSIGTTLGNVADVLETVETFPGVYGAVGIHPCYWEASVMERLHELEGALLHPKILAVGEIGLDFKDPQSDHRGQEELFRAQLSLAQRWDKPIVIHTRQAEDATLAALDEFSGLSGVLHCFTGSLHMARQALDRGFFISFSGIITFKKIMELHDVVRFVPWDRLLIETDAPFLAPAPYRGKPNQPAYVVDVAKFLCTLKGMEDHQKAARLMQDNFCKVFRPVGFRTEP